MGKIYEGQVGVLFELDTLDAMVGATTQEIRYLNGIGLAGSWTAAQDGTKLTFTTTLPTDLAVPGTWKFQAYAKGAGWEILGETVEYEIYRAFE